MSEAKKMNFPHDNEFETTTIAEVIERDDGFEIKRTDGWCLFAPEGDFPTPKPGDELRVYGRGIGYPYRGLYVNGHKIFYRTAAADSRFRDEQLYGKDAADLLARWDAKKGVFTVEMGGLGPGYEQSLQIAMFEVLRALLSMEPKEAAIRDSERWAGLRSIIDDVAFKRPPVSELGLSGAQAGAAVQLAVQFYLKGPIRVLGEVDSDRRIQVSNNIRFDFSPPPAGANP